MKSTHANSAHSSTLIKDIAHRKSGQIYFHGRPTADVSAATYRSQLRTIGSARRTTYRSQLRTIGSAMRETLPRIDKSSVHFERRAQAAKNRTQHKEHIETQRGLAAENAKNKFKSERTIRVRSAADLCVLCALCVRFLFGRIPRARPVVRQRDPAIRSYRGRGTQVPNEQTPHPTRTEGHDHDAFCEHVGSVPSFSMRLNSEH
jgi:hypothetical protein